MTKRSACPPPPSPGHSATLHFHTLTPDETLYRVYRGADSAQFRITTGDNRFDPLPSPWNATQVLYAGSTREVAISETVLRWHDRVGDAAKIILARSQIAGRQLVGIRWDHPVRLLDFTGFGMKPLAQLVGHAHGPYLTRTRQSSWAMRWAHTPRPIPQATPTSDSATFAAAFQADPYRARQIGAPQPQSRELHHTTGRKVGRCP
jgi:RES domain